ncbi:Peptidyl-tRNA hydrolase [Pleurostoma richardsiae]|uniref:Peptidyl-tRNA hydrolase n=1 Tax=Pleurostoma richardsiae TaxID=41990 RepID=A0AA38R6F3_9PEZI|nr:Peptidyl-tRNA hydrolase [Pleurostoma richardsiae]
MRFSLSSALLALPVLATAQDDVFGQYKAQFQNFLGQFGSYIPSPNKHDPVQAAAAKAGAQKMDVLTLSNWKDTLYGSVQPGQTDPEEWWILVSGGNKSCFGHCLKVETAFNETAAKFALLPDSPHVGYINCDDQPILCYSWSAGAGTLWVIEMLPQPAPIDVYVRRLNLTTTDSKTITDLHKSFKAGDKSSFKLHDGYFHPFNGPLAQNGLAVPVAWGLWLLNAVPSWAMMIGVSFLSRTMMNRRMGPGARGNAAGAAAAPPPRGAQPGDARGF